MLRGAHSDAVNNQLLQTSNQMGQPYPVLKSNWGLEPVKCSAVKNFEVLSKIPKIVKNV